MTKRKVLLAVAALGLWLAGAAPSHASTITEPGPQTGISYESQVVMGDLDLAHYHGSVGAKSWAEPGNPVGEKGWTHTSSWTALDLTGVSGPTLLTVELGRAEGGTSQLFPAFSIYQGWELTNSDLEAGRHTFNNTGNTGWITNLTYLDHVANVGGLNGTDSGTGLETVSKQWVLGPGLYSLVYGGNPSFALGQTGFQGFAATLTTAPVPVPAAVWLFGSGLAGLVGLARRRMAA